MPRYRAGFEVIRNVRVMFLKMVQKLGLRRRKCSPQVRCAKSSVYNRLKWRKLEAGKILIEHSRERTSQMYGGVILGNIASANASLFVPWNAIFGR